jgi:hypothetical protein
LLLFLFRMAVRFCLIESKGIFATVVGAVMAVPFDEVVQTSTKPSVH